MLKHYLTNMVAGGLAIKDLDVIVKRNIARTQLANRSKAPRHKGQQSTATVKCKAVPPVKSDPASRLQMAKQRSQNQGLIDALRAENDQLRKQIADLRAESVKRRSDFEQAGLSPGLARFAAGNNLPK